MFTNDKYLFVSILKDHLSSCIFEAQIETLQKRLPDHFVKGGASLRLYTMLLIAEEQFGQTNLVILTNIYLAILKNIYFAKKTSSSF